MTENKQRQKTNDEQGGPWTRKHENAPALATDSHLKKRRAMCAACAKREVWTSVHGQFISVGVKPRVQACTDCVPLCRPCAQDPNLVADILRELLDVAVEKFTQRWHSRHRVGKRTKSTHRS